VITFDEALGAHLDSLYGAARVLTGDAAQAEDLVQETALAAYRGWASLRAPGAVKRWLLTILRRTFLNAVRHRDRRPPFLDVDITALLEHPVLGTETRVQLRDDLLSDDVATALDALPLEFREAVWLVDVEELTMPEVAEVLDVPVGTVASRVHRARRLLRERLSRRPAPDGGEER
jgi:RNA polymerase sigma-70 factor (ECF subfamily)